MLLKTERLILREFTIEDLDAFAPLLANPEVMRFSLNGPVKDKEQAREYLQKRILDHYRQYGYGLYAAIDLATNTLIGYIGLIRQQIDGEDMTELGYRLHPNFWGKGLATEGGLAVCHYAFDDLKLTKLISIIDSKNERSLEVAKRLGMNLWKNTVLYNIPVQIYEMQTCKNFLFHFRPVREIERELIHFWLKKNHVAEWFYDQGYENTLRYLDEFLAGSSYAQYWLAFDKGHPFAFFITSQIEKPDDELTKWCRLDGRAITLDMSIGDENYLGKGFSVKIIHEFLLNQFPHIDEVLIDPEASNAKAIHVYEKAGFEKIAQFIPSYSSNPHVMMSLNLKKLKMQCMLK